MVHLVIAVRARSGESLPFRTEFRVCPDCPGLTGALLSRHDSAGNPLSSFVCAVMRALCLSVYYIVATKTRRCKEGHARLNASLLVTFLCVSFASVCVCV